MPDASTQKLLEELSKWKHNRSIYPGWLIAPEQLSKTLRSTHETGLRNLFRFGPV